MNREPSVFPVAPATVFPADSKPGVPDGLCDQRGAPMSTRPEEVIWNLGVALAQAEQERDAAWKAKDERQMEGYALKAERDRLRTALETINVGTNDKWVLAIARAALGSTNEPKETQTSKWRQAIGAVPRDEDGPRAEAVIRKIRDATNEPEETGT